MAKLTVLILVAQELQKLCEFEPAIKTKNKSEKELEKAIREAAEALTPDDKLSKDAVALFKELGITPGAPADAAGPSDDKEEEEEEEEEVEVEEEKPAKKEKKEKAEKPAKKEKAEKKERVKTILGTVADTQAGGVDKVLIAHKGKFVSIDDIAKEASVTNSRINTHIAFLNKQSRATIESKKEGKVISYKLVKAGA